MNPILIFILGVIVGIVIIAAVGAMSAKKQPVGDLKIVQTDADGPYLFLELYASMDTVRRLKVVWLRVVNQEYPHD